LIPLSLGCWRVPTSDEAIITAAERTIVVSTFKKYRKTKIFNRFRKKEVEL
jgi:1,2-phenylacetyl-CoA epoxidase PaaB subunit